MSDRLAHYGRRLADRYPSPFVAASTGQVGALLELYAGCMPPQIVVDGAMMEQYVVGVGLAAVADSEPELLWASVLGPKYCRALERALAERTSQFAG